LFRLRLLSIDIRDGFALHGKRLAQISVLGRYPRNASNGTVCLESTQRRNAMNRSANAVWHGGLKDGKGTVSTQSGAVKELQYSFGSRFESGVGTNPEELLGAAHAGCYSMALSAQFTEAGLKPETIDTTAQVTLEILKDGGPTITKIHLTTKVKAPGVDKAKFDELANNAKVGCPLSKVLKAAEITLDASLV